ncbi:MAG TPA: hypothetical protein VFK42_14500 [Acidimicrobiales bacterium]|nr:hypothetical protein [Acidimicrobiales bacterium]
MERLLARAALVLVLCNLAVVAVRAGGPTTRVHVRDVPAPGPTRTEIVLPAGQAVVSGTATAIAVDADVADPVPAPFTVDATHAAIRAVVVDGTRETVVWNGGRPLTITGGGPGIAPAPVHAELTADGVAITLDGAPRPLLAGSYATTAPVAVGAGGLATPRDGVAFTADAQSTLEATGTVRTGRRNLRFSGPGRLSATGTFTVRTRDGERRVATLVFGPGAFELSATPVAGGWAVTATLQGPLEDG